MCLPSEEQILNDVKREVNRIGARTVFVSTDKNHMLLQLNELFDRKVSLLIVK